jgi:hypothetical protein
MDERASKFPTLMNELFKMTSTSSRTVSRAHTTTCYVDSMKTIFKPGMNYSTGMLISCNSLESTVV